MIKKNIQPRKVAFFDIDGTIFRSSLIVHITDELINRGLFPADAKNEFKLAHTKWLERRADYEAYIGAVVRAFMTHIKGVAYTDFLLVCRYVSSIHKDRTYKHTRELMANLKSKGYYLLAVSQSPKTILDLVCPGYGFNKVYGRIYELGPGDKFTGKFLDEHLIANKANIIKRAVEKEGLTLKGSIGVGDTEDDIPMLELASKAIAFNPNKKLYKYAKRLGWEIVVERKDVVYKW